MASYSTTLSTKKSTTCKSLLVTNQWVKLVESTLGGFYGLGDIVRNATEKLKAEGTLDKDVWIQLIQTIFKSDPIRGPNRRVGSGSRHSRVS